MKPRKAEYGTKNICGANVERIRKALGMKQTTLISRMQLMGVDINPSSLSKLEGQTRTATDIELKAISKILGVPMEELVRTDEDELMTDFQMPRLVYGKKNGKDI